MGVGLGDASVSVSENDGGVDVRDMLDCEVGGERAVTFIGRSLECAA